MLKVSVLSENYAFKSGFLAEHGLSLWIETDNKKILFDTGQSDIFIKNARKMDISLRNADMLIISHGHYDHMGGIPGFCTINKKTNIFAHPGVLSKKLNFKNNKYFDIGKPWSSDNKDMFEKRMSFNTEPQYLDDNILITGEVPRKTEFENVPKSFFMKNNEGKIVSDLIIDEQLLIIEGKKGINIFAGCSHPGIVNCIEYASFLFPKKNINAVIGGMHLNNVSSTRINKTIEYFSNKNIRKIIPMHCTGFITTCEIKQRLGIKAELRHVGESFELE